VCTEEAVVLNEMITASSQNQQDDLSQLAFASCRQNDVADRSGVRCVEQEAQANISSRPKCKMKWHVGSSRGSRDFRQLANKQKAQNRKKSLIRSALRPPH
jgi:hypothetical protein